MEADLMVEPLTWVMAAGLAGVVIILVYVIVKYLWPVMSSPGKYFAKAKRDKLPVFILDDGPIFRFVLGTEKIDKDTEIIRAGPGGHDIIKKGPGSLKFADGVLMGVGESFRSFVANVGILDLMEVINEKGWNSEEVKNRLEELVTQLKKDLGISDDFKELKEWRDNKTKEILAEFERAREKVIKDHEVKEEGYGEDQE